MLYELRLYQTGLGRAEDVAARMRDLVPVAFKKHGFPVPLGQWRVSSGPRLPLYVWMLAWKDSQARAAAFAGLYGDPEWTRIRSNTNGPREMVLNYDIYFMHATKAADAIRALHADAPIQANALHELRIHQTFPGKTGYALDRLCDADLPAYKAAGATTLGVFDIQSGPMMPGLAHFLTWPSYEAREAGMARYESDPEVLRINQREADELKTHVIGRYDSWLMRATEFCPPLPGLAEKA